MTGPDSLILNYIYLAMACGALGMVITFVLILVCGYFQIDITKHVWLLAIPVTLSVLLNITFIELYRKHRKKRRNG